MDCLYNVGAVKKVIGKEVFVAMSGGVDSSVAALLLKRQGYDVVGVFMKCWTGSSTWIHADFYADKRENVSECGWEKDAEDARRVAEKIGIPFYTWDFEEEYKKKVVDYMIRGYKRGETPNPDVMCNREIKFGLFLERALKIGADYIATGHYVRLQRMRDSKLSRFYRGLSTKSEQIHANLRKDKFVDSGKFVLRRAQDDPEPVERVVVSHRLCQAKDKNKDQSYFLWTLTQKQLQYCLFPIGDYIKPEVRKIAKRAGLPTAEKKDSQGICFLGQVALADFLKEYLPEKRGAVLNLSGQKIGEHQGAHFYTIGQRHIGIKNYESRIRGRQDTRPSYVAKKDVKKNIIVVAEGGDNPALYRKEVALSDVNFIIPPVIHNSKFDIPVLARVRYRQPLAPATLIIADDKRTGADKNPRVSACKSATLRFYKEQRFVAPGQSAVLYIKHEARNMKHETEYEMLGGGVIRI